MITSGFIPDPAGQGRMLFRRLRSPIALDLPEAQLVDKPIKRTIPSRCGHPRQRRERGCSSSLSAVHPSLSTSHSLPPRVSVAGSWLSDVAQFRWSLWVQRKVISDVRRVVRSGQKKEFTRSEVELNRIEGSVKVQLATPSDPSDVVANSATP
jgi:hypothetical protein